MHQKLGSYLTEKKYHTISKHEPANISEGKKSLLIMHTESYRIFKCPHFEGKV